MKYFKYFAITSLAYCQIYIEIFYSLYTDLLLISTISDSFQQKFINQAEMRVINLSLNSSLINSEDISHAAIDLTFTLSLSNLIKEYATQKELILISIQDPTPSFDSWEFFTHPSEETQVNALSSIISYLNWEKIIFITDSSYMVIEKFLQNKNIKSFFFPHDETQKSAEILVKKEIKPTGIKNIVILNRGKTASYLLKSIADANLLNLGTGVILGCKSWQNATENGLFGIAEKELENSIDSYSYEALGIEKIINLLLKCNYCSDTHDMRQYLEKYTINHKPISNFTVLNIKNHIKTRIGYIFDQELFIYDAPIFIGNSSSIPNSPYTNITISMSDGSTNPGYSNSSTSSNFKQGAKYALMLAQEDNFIDGFEILVTHTDCGADVYDPIFCLNCFKKLKNVLGVGYLTTPYAVTSIGNILTLRALNISIPHISEYANVSNKTIYPEFMRMTKDNRYNTQGILNLFTIFNWKKFIIVHDQTPGILTSYQYLLSILGKTDFEIANPPEKRSIKQNYNHTDYLTYKPWMIDFYNSRVRIIILLMPPPSQTYFAEDLYNAGFRRGDAILFLYNRPSSTTFYYSDPSDIPKLWEIYYGTVTIDQAEWVGTYGQKIQSGFIKSFTKFTDYRCFSFDSANLLLNGIKYTIDQGQNIEDFATLNTNLRLQRFLGCSGTISIDKNSNDRSTTVVGIFNVKWNPDLNILYNYQIGTYDLGSQQLFTFTDPIIWYDNTTNIPNNLRTYPCGFDPKLVEFSTNGARVLYAVDACVLISIFITVSIIRKCWRNLKTEPLFEPKVAEFDDYLAFLVIFVDFLQFLYLGPDFSDYDLYLYQVVKLSMFRLDLKSNKYSFLAYFYISLILAFIIIIFSIQSLNWKGRIKISFWNIYEKIPKWIIPFIWSICYTPVIFTLLAVFQCDQSIGNEITDSFMEEDCNIFCWKGLHITYVVLSIAILVLYLPATMHLKPYLNYINTHSNVQVRPTFLLEKRAFQTIIVVLNNILLAHKPSIYGLIYILLIICFISISFSKLKPYNYNRCNLWLGVSYIAVICNVGIASIYELTDNGILVIWVLFQYGGWFFLIATGVLIQLKFCPGLLFTERPPDISIFFRFSLGRKITASQINQLNRDRSSKYEMAFQVSKDATG